MTRDVTALPYTEFEVADGNFDTSRADVLDRIVIHTTVSSAQSAMDHFGQYGTHVSAHYIIGLDGTIYHGLEETFTSYGAGDYSMNQRCFNLEHEDGGDYNGTRPDALYKTSAQLVRDICDFYNIPVDRDHIIKHSQVIPTGCPDALDIDRIVREAQAINKTDPLTECLRQHTDLVNKCTEKDKQISDLKTQLIAATDKNTTLQMKIDHLSTVTYQVPVNQQSSTTTASTNPISTNTVVTSPNQPILDGSTNINHISEPSHSWLSGFFHWLFNK